MAAQNKLFQRLIWLADTIRTTEASNYSEFSNSSNGTKKEIENIASCIRNVYN